MRCPPASGRFRQPRTGSRPSSPCASPGRGPEQHVMRNITRRWCARSVAAALVLIAPRAAVQTQRAPSPPADLATLFAPGGALQDRNGDGVIDFVNARVVLGERPGAADVSAAADLAARLGFETMAMNLPLSATPE